MDLPTLLWALLPVVGLHLLVARRRGVLGALLLTHLAGALLLSLVYVRGYTLGCGVPAAEAWGVAATALGSPEQTDLPLQLSVWWEEVRRLVREGEKPWVSDRIGGGVALFSHGQSGLPFPLHLPVWVLGAERGTVVTAVWKLALAALGMALWLRRQGVRPAAVATGAVGLALSLYQLSWLVSPVSWVVAACPWAFYLAAGARRGRPIEAAAMALLLGAMLGWSVNPAGLFLVGAVLVESLMGGYGRGRRLARLAYPLGVAALVGAAGAIPLAVEMEDSSKVARGEEGPRYPEPEASWSLRLPAMGQLLVPWRDGHPADGSWQLPFPAAAVAASPGTVPLVFLLAGGLRRRHRRLALGLGAVLAASAVLVYQLPGAAQLLARLPVLAHLTWARAAFLLPFVVLTLGALGLDAWLQRPRPGRLALAAGVLQLAALVAALLPPCRPLHPAALRTLFAPGTVAALSPVLPSLGGAAIPVLVAAEAVAQGWDVLPGVPQQAPAGEALQALLAQAAGHEGRVLGVGNALPANTAALWGLSDLRAHDPVRPQALARLHRALGADGADLPGEVTRPWANLAGAWGVRWLATPPEGVPEAQAAGWEEVWRGAGGRIYVNQRVLPVLRLVSRAIPSPGEPASGAWENVDFANTAVVEGDPPGLGGRGTFTLLHHQPSHWRVRVQADGEVLVLLHVPRAAGWRAMLDGQRVEMVTANLGAMGVTVPAGEHQVEWRYAPPGLAAGALLTGLGLVACLWLGTSGRRR